MPTLDSNEELRVMSDSESTEQAVHYLIVHKEIDPELNIPEYDVEHPDTCKEEELGGALYYRCPEGQELDYSGLDAFGWMRQDNNSWPREVPTEPGRYAFEAWGEKYWTDYGWEYDGGLRLIKEEV